MTVKLLFFFSNHLVRPKPAGFLWTVCVWWRVHGCAVVTLTSCLWDMETN